MKNRALEMELIDSVDDINSTLNSIQVVEATRSQKSWIMISGLVRENLNCPKLRIMRKRFIEVHKGNAQVFRELWADIRSYLTPEEYKEWTRSGAVDYLKWLVSIFCPILVACCAYSGCVKYTSSDSSEDSLEILSSSTVIIGISGILYLLYIIANRMLPSILDR